MEIIVVEQTSSKLILKVTDSSTLKGLGLCLVSLFAVASFFMGGSVIIYIIRFFLLSSFVQFYSLINIATYIGVFFLFLGIPIYGMLWLYESIIFFKDTKWTFDRNLRKLFIKNAKFWPKSWRPRTRDSYEYSFNKIESIKTSVEVKTVSTSSGFSRSYEVYELSILLTSKKKLIISTNEKTPINQERQTQIVSLIKNYLSLP